MKYLLDTCCISDFIKGDKNTIKHIQNNIPADLAISTITVMELQYGLLYNPTKAKKYKKIINDICNYINILPFTETDAKLAAQFRARLRKVGTPIGSYDVLIAGTAANNNLIVVTSNEKEFKRIDEINIENWR